MRFPFLLVMLMALFSWYPSAFWMRTLFANQHDVVFSSPANSWPFAVFIATLNEKKKLVDVQLPKPFCVIIIVFWYFVDLVECMQFYRVYFQQRRVHSLPPLFTLSIIRCCVGCFKSVRFIIRIFLFSLLQRLGCLFLVVCFHPELLDLSFLKTSGKMELRATWLFDHIRQLWQCTELDFSFSFSLSLFWRSVC